MSEHPKIDQRNQAEGFYHKAMFYTTYERLWVSILARTESLTEEADGLDEAAIAYVRSVLTGLGTRLPDTISNETTLGPIFKYNGSKTKFFDWYAPHIPTDTTMFVDMFAGGLGATTGAYNLNRRGTHHINRFVINELNRGIANIYRVLQSDVAIFIIKLINVIQIFDNLNTYSKKSLVQELERLFNDYHEMMSEIDRAVLLYVLMLGAASWGIKTGRAKPFYASAADFTKPKIFSILRLAHRLQKENTFIFNRSWDQIPEHIIKPDGKTVFFADPPYRMAKIDYGFPFDDNGTHKMILKMEKLPGIKIFCNERYGEDDIFYEQYRKRGWMIEYKNVVHSAKRGNRNAIEVKMVHGE